MKIWKSLKLYLWRFEDRKKKRFLLKEKVFLVIYYYYYYYFESLKNIFLKIKYKNLSVFY